MKAYTSTIFISFFPPSGFLLILYVFFFFFCRVCVFYSIFLAAFVVVLDLFEQREYRSASSLGKSAGMLIMILMNLIMTQASKF